MHIMYSVSTLKEQQRLPVHVCPPLAPVKKADVTFKSNPVIRSVVLFPERASTRVKERLILCESLSAAQVEF